VLVFLACVLTVVASAAGEPEMYEQTVYDESMDVVGGTWAGSQAHTEVDILWVSVLEVGDHLNIEMRLVGNASPDAIYSVRFRVDNMYDAVLECRNGTEFTGSDDRVDKWQVTGEQRDDRVVWNVPLGYVNATSYIILQEGTAEIFLEKPTRFHDECSWDLTDRLKGQVFVWVEYQFYVRGNVTKFVVLRYEDESAAGFRFEMDMDGDRFVTQEEIDQYVEELETLVNGTDMSIDFEQHTSTLLVPSIDITPGPINLARENRVSYHLYIKYPKPPASEMNVRWELELHRGSLPYTRATDNSKFEVMPPDRTSSKVYRFGQWDVSELEKQYYNSDFTKFVMNGTALRTHWMDLMLDDDGFTLFLERNEEPGDPWTCTTTFGVVLVPVAFVAFTGSRRYGRPGRP
jgi:hypothetical protein